MKALTNVVRLDFYTIRQYLGIKQLGLYGLVGLFIGIGLGEASAALGMLMIYGMFYASYPFLTAEKNQLDLLYLTLPLDRRQVVRGRYLFAFCVTLLFLVFSLLLVVIFAVIQKEAILSVDQISAGGTLFFFVTFIELLQLPFYFKLGYSKAKIIAMLPILFIPLAVVFAGKLFGDLSVPLARLLENPLPLFVGAALVWLLGLLVSMALSQRFYDKRSF